MSSPPRAGLVAAFLSVYVIWGSTYLAIKFGVESFPPFLMAGVRWIMAGALLFAWRRSVSRELVSWRMWRSAAVIGALLIVGGNGLVSFAQQWVPSGLTALLIAVVPVWIALLEWAGPARRRPTARVAMGIGLGLVGVSLLVAPAIREAVASAQWIYAVGVLVILAASFSWANGSLYSRRAPLPRDTLLAASMEMLAGGAILVALGLATGEAPRVDLAAASPRAWLSFGFLVLFGSIVAYSAYVWLLQVTRAELVATYAFVNPVVAVLLGVFLAAEAFTWRLALVAALVVVAVAVIVTAPKPPAARVGEPEPAVVSTAGPQT